MLPKLKEIGRRSIYESLEEWIDRDSQGRPEKARNLDKQQQLTSSWKLVRECRKILKENCSSWQEKETTEEDKWQDNVAPMVYDCDICNFKHS